MQTRTYGDLFKTTSALIGTGGQLDVTEQDQLSHFINRRFQQAFDESPVWPRYFVPSEERDIALYTLSKAAAGTSTNVNQGYRFLGKSSGSNTTPGTNVYQGLNTSSVFIYKNSSNAWIVVTGTSFSLNSDRTVTVDPAGDQVIQFTEADAVKNDKLEDVVKWTPRGGGEELDVVTSSYIPYSAITGTSIGEFNRIHKKRAFVNNSSMEYDFFVDLNGANILNISYPSENFDKLSNLGGTTAFVSYKKQFTPFTVTSDYYNSVVEVPAEFFNYIAHAVYSDFLRVQNRQQEAISEEQVAQTYLALELEKIDIRNNNNTVNKRFSTYVNRQSR
tara:strand:+ start:600 stop:1595 length:996 start_codon:yes stop_codon:yes gene_type:complete